MFRKESGLGLIVALDLTEHPARGGVNSHNLITTAGFVEYLGQEFKIDVDVPRIEAF